MVTPGSTSARGYGHGHQVERDRWRPAVEAGEVNCARCRRRITPGTPWDLGHTDDRSAYQGPEHRSCNRSAGAANSHARRAMTVRDW